MSDLALRRSGAALAGAVGLLHLALAPEYLTEQLYVGVLFLVGGVALLAAAVGIWRHATVAWLTAAATSVGMLVGGVASRTVGLPGFKESDWELSLLVSLVLEAALLAVSVRPLLRAGRRRADDEAAVRPATPAAVG
jgi:hypothetical protein